MLLLPLFLILFSCGSMNTRTSLTQDISSTNESFFIPNEKRNLADSFQTTKAKPYHVNIINKESTGNKVLKLTRPNTFSVNFRSTKLSTAFEMLSNEGKSFSYVLSPQAADKSIVGLVLKDVTWKDAIEVIVNTHMLNLRKENNFYIVCTNSEYETKLRKEMELVKLEKERAGLNEAILTSNLKTGLLEGEREKTFRSFRLKYTQPEQVILYLEKIYSDTSTKTIGKASNNSTDFKLNSNKVLFSIFPNSSILTAYGVPSSLLDVEKRLEEIDIPQKQVYIESRIVEIRRNYTRSLGIEWGGYNISTSDQPFQLSGGNQTASGNINSSLPNSVVSFPATMPNSSIPVAGGLGVLIGNSTGTSRLFGRLSALEQDGKSKTLSNPKITTINGVQATIQSGQQIPYQAQTDTSTGAITTTVKFQDAVISLEVTPYITTDNRINMKIFAKKDNPDFSNQVLNVPTISTRKISTNVLVNNGGTAVLGGVFENLESRSEQGIPLFSKIPFLGWLFKGSNTYDDEKELLIFITPHIIGEDIS